jgi:hypothetical protein
VAGFSTFRDIIAACERGEPLPPQIEALGTHLASELRKIADSFAAQVAETVNFLEAAFDGAPAGEVIRLFEQFPNEALAETTIGETPKRICKIAKWFEVHQRKLPKRFCKIIAKQLKRYHVVKPPKNYLRKPVTVGTPKVKRIRAPNSREKANDEDAEGDADSHNEFWFAAVTPRAVRAPTRVAHRGGSGRLGSRLEPLTG